MRPISFAVISLLAITVSAHLPLSTSATNDAPQCDKDVIMHKILELTTAHKAQQELIKKLEEPGKAEREEQEIKSVMEEIEKELKKTGLPRGERSSLEGHYAGSVDDLKKAQSALVDKKEDLRKAMKKRSCMEVKLDILNETLEQKAEQDAKDKSKTGASPSSNPHRKILGEQIDETCPNAADLFATYNDLREGVFKLDDVRKRVKNPRKSKLSKARDNFVNPYNKLLGEFRVANCKCTHAKEFQADFGWQLQSSLTERVTQSVRQMFSK
ncbi:hypothetical protein BASA61_002251 [Batrachochytrium salamandrivorans]|nr:hypothetical protein BASA61_002251 [Batrachochytrium salamandrivorans]KAH9270578.1 hypothetical protein BASA83_007391 [Batrachochytrium salamandrivorans]